MHPFLQSWNKSSIDRESILYQFKKHFTLYDSVSNMVLQPLLDAYFNQYSKRAVPILAVLLLKQDNKNYMYDTKALDKLSQDPALLKAIELHGSDNAIKALNLYHQDNNCHWMTRFHIVEPLIKEGAANQDILESLELGYNVVIHRLIHRITHNRLFVIHVPETPFNSIMTSTGKHIPCTVENCSLIHKIIDNNLIDWWIAHDYLMKKKVIENWINEFQAGKLNVFMEQNTILKNFHQLELWKHHFLIRNNARYLNTPNNDFNILRFESFDASHFDETRSSIEKKCNKLNNNTVLFKSYTFNLSHLFFNKEPNVTDEISIFI